MAEALDWATMLDALADVLAETGGAGWLVGGCLRDALLGTTVADVDVALTGGPLPVAERLAQRLPLAVARLGHGTIRLSPRATPHVNLDLSAVRGDDIAADLNRRDFTVNALALPLSARDQWLARIRGQHDDMPDLIDPFGGRDDTMAHRLVAVGREVFRHDAGRIVRAARLRARFGLQPDGQTLRLACEAVPLLITLSADRLRDEIALLLALPSATDGVDLLGAVGALASLYPGLSGDSVTHALATLRTLDMLVGAAEGEAPYPALYKWSASGARRIALRQAALAHAQDAHASASTDDAAKLWQRALAALDTDGASERLYAVRLLFARAGKDQAAAADALLVAAACVLADDERRGRLLAARANALIGIFLNNRHVLTPEPLVTGKDLIAALALPAGPAIGRLLQALRLAQLADEITNREEALALARRLHIP